MFSFPSIITSSLNVFMKSVALNIIVPESKTDKALFIVLNGLKDSPVPFVSSPQVATHLVDSSS